MESLESFHRQCLHENVSNHLIGKAVVDFDCAMGNHLMNEVVADVYVFGACVVLIVYFAMAIAD